MCSFNFLDALVRAPHHVSAPSASPSTPCAAAPSPPALGAEQSYHQFPYEKASLLGAHELVFDSHPRQPAAAHCAFATSNLLGFHVLPASKVHLQQNDLLWHAVNGCSLSVPNHLQSVLHPFPGAPSASIFALAVPYKLVAFLRRVSLSDMRQAVVTVLADAVQGETEQGVAHIRRTLHPSVWHALTAVLSGQCHHTPSSTQASDLLDCALLAHEQQHQWRIPVISGVFGSPTLPFLSGAVLQSMNEDWMLYLTHISNERIARAAMHELTREGRQAQVMERVSTVFVCAQHHRSHLSLLPMHIVESALIPWLLLAETGGARQGLVMN